MLVQHPVQSHLAAASALPPKQFDTLAPSCASSWLGRRWVIEFWWRGWHAPACCWRGRRRHAAGRYRRRHAAQRCWRRHAARRRCLLLWLVGRCYMRRCLLVQVGAVRTSLRKQPLLHCNLRGDGMPGCRASILFGGGHELEGRPSPGPGRPRLQPCHVPWGQPCVGEARCCQGREMLASAAPGGALLSCQLTISSSVSPASSPLFLRPPSFGAPAAMPGHACLTTLLHPACSTPAT